MPAEGLDARTVARRFGALDRHRLLFGTGFVSDDTEQSALVAEALVVARRKGPLDVARAERHLRRGLVGWFLRLPFGIGFATLRACVRSAAGVARPGVRSAGNGAAMRAAIAGVALKDDAAARREISRRFAELTHVDPRAVEAAGFMAELAAEAALGDPGDDRAAMAARALGVVHDESLRAAIERALALASAGAPEETAAREIGTTGFALHSAALVAFVFARCGDDPVRAIRAAIRAGGDTDTHAAMAGALAGALHGDGALPRDLLDAIHDGPFGPAHLRALARALAEPGSPPPPWSATCAMARNLALYPVILAHGLRRLVPLP